ncbi:glycosyltransferase family 2 protein [Flavisphingomonas formosensis]|uniref:glycosyltransferase family 2 protein n=1 Tax=Flavisphingomonas formosensis TaxID=861534 RepID=UPI0012FBD1DD|nr:glycosyltransferase family A protein [Sphingomonas formosensis]
MKPSAPAISVIIPAYGLARYVAESLSSLQAQSFANWEAVVVDDGAPDDVKGALAPFSADPRVRLLQTDNGGVSVARNRGVAAARSGLIALLDGDDIYEPNYLERMVAALKADPGLGFVCCDATYFGSPIRLGRLFSDYCAQETPITLDKVLRRRFNVFTAATIRRTAFEAVGGYDTLLRTAEDFDLWVRMLGAGWSAAYLPEPLVRYRRRAGSLSSDTLGMLRMTRIVYEKAAEALPERPEAATATAMAEQIGRQIQWEEGELLIRSGQVAAGLRLLDSSGVERRSLRWRIAMPLMRALPSIAKPMLDYRRRQYEQH